jgi:hypothetical protein
MQLLELSFSLHTFVAALLVAGGVFAIVEAFFFALELAYLRTAPRPQYDRTELQPAISIAHERAIESMEHLL